MRYVYRHFNVRRGVLKNTIQKRIWTKYNQGKLTFELITFSCILFTYTAAVQAHLPILIDTEPIYYKQYFSSFIILTQNGVGDKLYEGD